MSDPASVRPEAWIPDDVLCGLFAEDSGRPQESIYEIIRSRIESTD